MDTYQTKTHADTLDIDGGWGCCMIQKEIVVDYCCAWISGRSAHVLLTLNVLPTLY